MKEISLDLCGQQIKLVLQALDGALHTLVKKKKPGTIKYLRQVS